MAEFAHPELLRAEMWIAGLIGVAATVEDLFRRTISNWLSLAALAGGILCQCMTSGWRGLLTALAGAAAGFGIFLIFYILGGMGGGDVKLMAGFGALLGAGRLLHAAFWTALLGGVLAAVVVTVHMLRNRRKAAGDGSSKPLFVPYAPAIASGVWLALLSTR